MASRPEASRKPRWHRCMVERNRFTVVLHDFSIYVSEDKIEKECPCQLAQCAICLDLKLNLFCLDGRVTMESASRDLVLSATEGCQTCSIIQEGIEIWCREYHAQDESFIRDWADGKVRLRAESGSPLNVEVFTIESYDHHKFELELYTLSGDTPSPWSALGTAAHLETDLSLENCIAFAKEHLRNCAAEHQCLPPSPSELPTRIINVGLADAPQAVTPRAIRLEDSNGKHAQYITLSHCWGPSQTLPKTELITLAARQQEIPYSELPKTFRDAIDITRHLGIQYLWIDSLCIIQDDLEDWARESAHMAGVYSGAFLTIAATAAPDSSAGCLFRRNILDPHRRFERKQRAEWFPFQPIKLQRGILRESHNIFIRTVHTQSHTQLFSADRGKYVDGEDQAPLLQRAWAFQERFLSPRVLHFHMEEMMWQCRDQYACECGSVQKPLSRLHTASDEALLGIWKSSLPFGTLLVLWYKIVNHYSSLLLSYESDRLPALSGVTNLFSAQIRGEYLAGLWRADFLRGLSWRTDHHHLSQTHTTRIDECSVPSWSWASVKQGGTLNRAAIRYHGFQDFTPSSRTRIVDVQCPLATTNIYGNVREGRATIAGPIVPVEIFESTNDDEGLDGLIIYCGDDFTHQGQLATGFIDIRGPRGYSDEVCHGGSFVALLLGSEGEVRDVSLMLKMLSSDCFVRVGIICGYREIGSWFDKAKVGAVTIV